MPVTEFEKQEKTLIVKAEGKIDTKRTPQLDNELQAHLDGVETVVFDCTKVEYICSSFLRLLLWLERKMEEAGGEVRIIHANETVMETFRLSGFMAVIHVIED